MTPSTKSKVGRQTPKTTIAQEGGEYVRTAQLEPGVAMEAKESMMWLYVVVAVMGLAVVASILALRMRRRI
jgi:hypothetical protein